MKKVAIILVLMWINVFGITIKKKSSINKECNEVNCYLDSLDFNFNDSILKKLKPIFNDFEKSEYYINIIKIEFLNHKKSNPLITRIYGNTRESIKYFQFNNFFKNKSKLNDYQIKSIMSAFSNVEKGSFVFICKNESHSFVPVYYFIKKDKNLVLKLMTSKFSSKQIDKCDLHYLASIINIIDSIKK